MKLWVLRSAAECASQQAAHSARSRNNRLRHCPCFPAYTTGWQALQILHQQCRHADTSEQSSSARAADVRFILAALYISCTKARLASNWRRFPAALASSLWLVGSGNSRCKAAATVRSCLMAAGHHLCQFPLRGATKVVPALLVCGRAVCSLGSASWAAEHVPTCA